VQQKWNFQRGGGPFCEPILENPEGRGGHRKNPFCGGVWIFSGTTQCKLFIGDGKKYAVFGVTSFEETII